MAVGSTYRRCSCRGANGKPLGSACPKLKQSKHGQWGWRLELPPDAEGNRRPRRRGGFESETTAQAELDHARALLALAEDGDTSTVAKIGDLIAAAISEKVSLPPVAEVQRKLRANVCVTDNPTVAEWLTQWLPTKKRKLSRNGYRSYESHVRLYLIPYIGSVRLGKLRVAHVADMFDAIVEHNTEIVASRASKDPARRETVKWQRPVGPTSLQRIRETLRTALNAAIPEGLVVVNAAKWVELPPVVRPKPLVWTQARIGEWQRTGTLPSPVMIWTPAQTGHFLDHVVDHRLYPLFLLIAHRGLRRGEACGARWPDTDLDAGTLDVTNQIVQYGWETGMSRPKTTSSEGVVALDLDLITVLRAHRIRQLREREAAGAAWVETGGLMFTEPDGSALHPADVTDVFQFLAAQAGLPPIRLHDLRHGAATLALAAGVDMKVVQEMLRHSSITVTSDTYTTVLPEVARAAAEKTALIIPRSRSKPLGHASGTPESIVDGEHGGDEYQKGQVNVDVDL
ncbi:tyrosine-type recombinase/integrase, partial [Kibdelosporangium philippinense]